MASCRNEVKEELDGEQILVRACRGSNCVEENRKIEGDIDLTLELP